MKRKFNIQPKAKKSTLPFVLSALICAGGSYWAAGNVDEVIKLASRVKVSSFSLVKAAEKELSNAKKNDETKVKKEEKNSSDKNADKQSESDSKKSWSEEEVKAFSKLEERKRELDEREAELQKLEEELHQQKVTLDDKIKQLEKMRQNIGAVLKDRTVADSEKVDRLVEFYSNMKPQNAAKIFEEINEGLAVELLSRLKKKNAADIMNLIKPDKAQRLSEKFAGYRK